MISLPFISIYMYGIEGVTLQVMENHYHVKMISTLKSSVLVLYFDYNLFKILKY